MKSLLVTFLSLFLTFSLKASQLSYVEHVDAALEERLVSLGKKIVKVLYEDGDLSKLDVLSLLAKAPKKKKSLLQKLKAADLTLSGRKSSADEENKAKRRDWLAKIVAIVWYLNSRGKDQGVTVDSVSWKLIDNHHKVYNFLKGYVEFASKHSKSFAYDRSPQKGHSSHYKEESPESQFGIDIRFYANQASLKILPHNKKHLLFGLLELGGGKHVPLTFVKFEHHGIESLSEKVAHGWSFFKGKFRSSETLDKKRIEKVVITPLKEAYARIGMKVSGELSDSLFLSEPRTVRTMLLALESLVKKDNRFSKDFDSFKALLEKTYPYDKGNIYLRSGNEVILVMP